MRWARRAAARLLDEFGLAPAIRVSLLRKQLRQAERARERAELLAAQAAARAEAADLRNALRERALIRQCVLAAHPGLAHGRLDDLQRVELLRQWAYERTNAASESLLFEHNGKSLSELLVPLLEEQTGVWCGGAARVLELLYQEFGFESYSLNVGRDDLGSHVSTLVWIRHRGQPRLIIEDAYLNESYLDGDDQPLDYYCLLDLLKRRQHARVHVVQHQGTKLCLQHPADEPYGYDTHGEPLARLPNGIGKYRVAVTFDHLERSELGLRAALARAGYPPSLLYLYLFPVGISGGDNAESVLARTRELLSAP